MNILGQQNRGFEKSNLIEHLGNFRNTLSSASNVFQRLTKNIDNVNNHPLTRQIEKRVPELNQYINKSKDFSNGLQKTSNSLEKAQKKLQEVENRIKYM